MRVLPRLDDERRRSYRCRIRFPIDTPEIRSGHLKMGGTNPSGVQISANSQYLTFDRRPWLPVMGEFHFSRYPRAAWEDELLKMQAGGVDIVAFYLFWNHHEEIEGEFLWEGSRDVRALVELCKRHGLWAFARIGPWAHGEARHGGFPDWLLQKCGSEVRKDAQPYLAFVRRYFGEITRQLNGLLWKDGGPVIGIQLENELTAGADHILTLKKMALDLGLEVPLYTMTGWGPAQVPEDEVIPVFGAYPDAFWDRHLDDWSRECRKGYLFSPLRDDNTIATDLLQYPASGDLSYLERYPHGTCETGGGIMPSYHRRPLICPEDVEAIAYCKVGRGSNLLGYYMYHGGSHPVGRLSTLQETQAVGNYNDLPVINYDFQAPLGEFGQVRGHYHGLRRLHLFLRNFGARLAEMPMTLPGETPLSLDDRQTLRGAARSKGQSGFLFVNNYQRIESLPAHPGAQFCLEVLGEEQVIPSQPVEIPSGAYFIWPVHFSMDGLVLAHATAQPVCRVMDGQEAVYGFAETGGIPAEFAFEKDVRVEAVSGSLRALGQGARVLVKPSAGAARQEGALEGGAACFRVKDGAGRAVKVLLLDPAQAEQAYQLDWLGQSRLFLSRAALFVNQAALVLQSTEVEDFTFAVFPPPDGAQVEQISRAWDARAEGLFARFSRRVAEVAVEPEVIKLHDAGPARDVPLGLSGVAQAPSDEAFAQAAQWRILLPGSAFEGAQDVILRIDYAGDAARLTLGGRLIADDFYHGRPFEVGLKRFAPRVLEESLELSILPLRSDAPVYLPPEARPAFGSDGTALELRGVCAVPVYQVEVAAEGAAATRRAARSTDT